MKWGTKFERYRRHVPLFLCFVVKKERKKVELDKVVFFFFLGLGILAMMTGGCTSLGVVCDCKEMGRYEQVERIQIWDLLCVSVSWCFWTPSIEALCHSFVLIYGDGCSNQRYNHF
jgi:hypothetical protein